MDAKSVKQFDRCLNLFVWFDVDEINLKALESTENFTRENYKMAVGHYLKWKDTILPKLKESEKEDLHCALAQLTYNIIHEHAPKDHHFHKALEHY